MKIESIIALACLLAYCSDPTSAVAQQPTQAEVLLFETEVTAVSCAATEQGSSMTNSSQTKCLVCSGKKCHKVNL